MILPSGEPIIRYELFVMNSEEEIQQAVADFDSARFVQMAARRDSRCTDAVRVDEKAKLDFLATDG